MKSSTKDRTEGKYHEVKGKAKEKVGKMKKDPAMQDRGNDEMIDGKIQKGFGKAEKALGD